MCSISSKIKTNKQTLEVNLVFDIIRSFKCSLDVDVFFNIILEGFSLVISAMCTVNCMESLGCAWGGVEVVWTTTTECGASSQRAAPLHPLLAGFLVLTMWAQEFGCSGGDDPFFMVTCISVYGAHEYLLSPMARQFHPKEESNEPPGRAAPLHPFQVCPWHVPVLTILKQHCIIMSL